MSAFKARKVSGASSQCVACLIFTDDENDRPVELYQYPLSKQEAGTTND